MCGRSDARNGGKVMGERKQHMMVEKMAKVMAMVQTMVMVMEKWWASDGNSDGRINDKSNGNSDGVSYGSTCMRKLRNRRENGGGADSKIVHKNGGVSDAGNDGGALGKQ